MKKTNKTMLTAAILSAACAVATRIQPESYVDQVSAVMAPVYGPPPSYTTTETETTTKTEQIEESSSGRPGMPPSGGGSKTTTDRKTTTKRTERIFNEKANEGGSYYAD